MLDPFSAEPTTEEIKHHADERRFWKRQIGVAKWLNGITGIAAVIAIGGLFVVYDATVEADRAWISPYSPQITWTESPPQIGDQFYLGIPYINAGKSPALDVAAYQEQFRLRVPTKKRVTVDDFSPEINKTCEEVGSQLSGKTGIVWAFIPGVTKPQMFGPANKERFTVDGDFLAGTNLLGVRGCLRYKTFWQPHSSRYCYIWAPRYAPNGKMVAADQWAWTDCPGENQNSAD